MHRRHLDSIRSNRTCPDHFHKKGFRDPQSNLMRFFYRRFSTFFEESEGGCLTGIAGFLLLPLAPDEVTGVCAGASLAGNDSSLASSMISASFRGDAIPFFDGATLSGFIEFLLPESEVDRVRGIKREYVLPSPHTLQR